MTVSHKAVLLPWLGEFGWMIMQHVRWAHACQADFKIVCCHRARPISRTGRIQFPTIAAAGIRPPTTGGRQIASMRS